MSNKYTTDAQLNKGIAHLQSRCSQFVTGKLFVSGW